MSAFPVLQGDSCGRYEPQCISDTQGALFYTGMALIAVGIAGYDVSLRPFLDEQKDTSDDHDDGDESSTPMEITTIVLPWVLVILVGAIALPYIKAWSLAFGIPAICTAFATLDFLTGWCKYRKVIPHVGGRSPLTHVLRVFVNQLYKKDWRETFSRRYIYICCLCFIHVFRSIRACSNLFAVKCRRLENNDAIVLQDQGSWSLCSLVAIWITFITRGIVSSTKNTYFIEQANRLDRKVGSWDVPIELLLAAQAWDLISTLIPDINRSEFMHDFSGRDDPLVWTRMAMGYSVLGCITAAAVEIRRLKVIRRHGLLDKPDENIPMKVSWLYPRFFLLASMDFVFELGIGAFYKNESTRKYVRLFVKGVTGVGFVCGAVSVYVVGKVSDRKTSSSWFQLTLNRSRLDMYYWVLAVLSSVNLLLLFLVPYVLQEEAVAENGRESVTGNGGESAVLPSEESF